MADFTAKAGDSLSDLEVQLIDRTGEGMDLSNAATVLTYVRAEGAVDNTIDGVACEMIPADPTLDEDYPQRVKGPDVVLEIPGRYLMYFKALYPPFEKRVPSRGMLNITIEASFE